MSRDPISDYMISPNISTLPKNYDFSKVIPFDINKIGKFVYVMIS